MPCSYNHEEYGVCKIQEHCETSMFHTLDGNNYCAFHLPELDSNGMPSIRAGWSGVLYDKQGNALKAYVNHCNSHEADIELPGTIIDIPLEVNPTLQLQVRNLNLCEAMLNKHLNLTGMRNPKIRADKAIFKGQVTLTANNATSEIHFRETLFCDQFVMSNCILGKTADFTKSEFHKEVTFNTVKGVGPFTFDESIFHSTVTLNGCSQLSNSSFVEAVFEQGFSVNDSSLQSANFTKTSFKGPVKMTGTIAHGMFASAHFEGAAIFRSACLDSCDFLNVTFEESADFNNTTIQNEIVFDKAEFKSNFIFSSSDGESRDLPFLGCSETTFNRGANFSNREFNAPARFKSTVFFHAPLFHGCKFHQDMDFPEMKNFKEKSGKSASRAYRTLRYAMEGFRATREQSMFFALEQISFRNSDASRIDEKIVSILYQWLSNFGQSISRPLIWFLGILFTFAQIYCWSSSVMGCLACYSKAFQFAVLQYVKPFSVWIPKADGELCDWPVLLLGTIQSITGLTLITLFLLALRWKFRRV